MYHGLNSTRLFDVIDITERTLILHKVLQVKTGYFCMKRKVKEKEPLFCCWTCTILLLMVGKFEREISTKLITLLILRLPAKIQKYQIGPAERSIRGCPERRHFCFTK